MTDSAAGQVEYTDYLPFGGQREHAGSTFASYRYTDQELDPSTGLYNYDARLYDPVVGRFVSPDSLIPNIYNPQSLNRYSYVRNNPLKYTDPSGHQEVYEHFDIIQFIRQFFGMKDRVKDFSAPAEDLQNQIQMVDPDDKQKKIKEASDKAKEVTDTIDKVSDATTDKERDAPKEVKGKWKTPKEWAEHDHAQLRDRLRKEQRGFESGRHDQYPSAMRDELKRMADEADARGELPEYGSRLREIANTYDKRTREAHRGGARK